MRILILCADWDKDLSPRSAIRVRHIVVAQLFFDRFAQLKTGLHTLIWMTWNQ
jgi:hypothetical protein